ncbi:hypothetical protein ACFL2V_17905 [Pseudomonadota bacterium]
MSKNHLRLVAEDQEETGAPKQHQSETHLLNPRNVEALSADVQLRIDNQRLGTVTVKMPPLIGQRLHKFLKAMHAEDSTKNGSRGFDREKIEGFLRLIERFSVFYNGDPKWRSFFSRLQELFQNPSLRQALVRIGESSDLERNITSQDVSEINFVVDSSPLEILAAAIDSFELEPVKTIHLSKRLRDKHGILLKDSKGHYRTKIIDQERHDRNRKTVRVVQDLADLGETYPRGFRILGNSVQQMQNKREINRHWIPVLIDLIIEARRAQTQEYENENEILELTYNLGRMINRCPELDAVLLATMAKSDPFAARELGFALEDFHIDRKATEMPYIKTPISSIGEVDALTNDIRYNASFKERGPIPLRDFEVFSMRQFVKYFQKKLAVEKR